MRITLLFEPSTDRGIPFAAGPERYQRLAEELGHYAGAPVQIVNDVLRNASPDAYILFAGSSNLSRSLDECGPDLAARLAPRIVLLDVSWQKAIAQLEKHRIAGAVDSLRLSEWLARPSSSAGPFGLRYLVTSLGCACAPLLSLCSDHYCLLHSERHQGMPHLLAEYLVAYDRDQKPLSSITSVALSRVAASQVTQGRTVQAAQVESVSIKRVIDLLRRARESASMPLSQVEKMSGIDNSQIGLLEESNYGRVTLGTLRAYALALQPEWNLTLSESACPTHVHKEKGEKKPELVRPTAEIPWVQTDRGTTFVGGQLAKRRFLEPESYKLDSQMRKGNVNARV